MSQAVEIRRRTDQPLVDQLLDDFVAQTVDIHGAARDEVDDRLLELSLAGQAPHTAVDRALADRFTALAALDQLGALHGRTAHRALLWHMHGAGIGRATFGDHAENLRDYVTGAAHDHRVTDHHTQAGHFIHVV